MSHKKTNYLITLVCTFIITFGCISRTEGLKKEDVEPLVNNILSMHVAQDDFNDEISERTFMNILSYLDPWKLYFTRQDIATLSKDKFKIDDYVAKENYDFLQKIFKLYQTRFNDKMVLFDKLIKRKYDFDKDESMSIERDKISYADTEKELEDRWRKHIKFQLLNHINSGKNIKEAKNKVIKKYQLIKKDIHKMDSEQIFSIFVNSFATALDPHSNYMTPEEYQDFKISMELKLEGIGAVLASEDGFVYVNSIIPGGPASKLKGDLTLEPNDKIIAVAQGNDEPEEVIDVPLREAVQKIRGKKGTIVKLTIIRTDVKTKKQKQFVLPIKRDRIVLEQQAAKSDVYIQKNKAKSTKIGYIKLPSFYFDYSAFKKGNPNAKMSSQDVLEAIFKLKKENVDGIVFDLRGNPGGALPEAIRIAGFFIKSGPVLQIKSHRFVMVEQDRDPKMYYDKPLVVLIDKFSASASEIFAGAMKDYKRGLILGPTPTFGKGTVQDLRELNNNKGAIKVTINLFYQPSGNSNHLYGIEPDIKIPALSQLLDIGEDKLKYPLNWKPIKSSDYTSFNNKYLTPQITRNLQNMSNTRLKNDKDFIELMKKIKEYEKKLATKTVSLKKHANDDITKEVVESHEENEKKLKENEQIIDIKTDIFLREAFNITADYIKILQKK